jgi:KRAB domain-containing zinc finger protein
VEVEEPLEDLRENKLQCVVCEKIMKSKRVLKLHTERVHEKKNKFECDHCPMVFYHKSNLKKHITARHIFTNDDTSNSNRPFKCNSCNKFFKTKDKLEQHEAVH